MTPRLAIWNWLLPRGPLHAAVLAICAAVPGSIVASRLGLGSTGLYDGHIELASSLVHGLGYRFSAEEPLVLHRPPLYPLLITPIAALPESAWRMGLTVLHSLLVAMASAQTFSIGRRWFGPTIAAWGVLIFLCDPWMFSVLRTTRTGFPELCLYLAVCAWFLEWAVNRDSPPTWRQASLFGVVGGLLTLTHASKLLTMAMLIATLVIVLALRRNWRAIGALAMAVLAMAAVIAPWTYRNYVVSGRFVPVATNAGFAYFAGNARWGITGPLSYESSPEDRKWQALALENAGVEAKPEDVGRFWGVYSPDLNEELDRRMKEHAIEHPRGFLRKAGWNALAAYFPVAHTIYVNQRVEGKQISAGFNSISWSVAAGALWIAALAGLARGSVAGDPRAAWWMLPLIVAFVVPYLPFVVATGPCGYVLPTIPLLALLAARCRAYWPMPHDA